MRLRFARSTSCKSISMRWSRTWSMPEAAAVIDASPLILLSRISRLDLLLTLERRLVVPVSVLEEIRAKGDEDPTVREVERADYLEEVPALPISEPSAGGISAKVSPRCSHGPRDTAGHWLCSMTWRLGAAPSRREFPFS